VVKRTDGKFLVRLHDIEVKCDMHALLSKISTINESFEKVTAGQIMYKIILYTPFPTSL